MVVSVHLSGHRCHGCTSWQTTGSTSCNLRGWGQWSTQWLTQRYMSWLCFVVGQEGACSLLARQKSHSSFSVCSICATLTARVPPLPFVLWMQVLFKESCSDVMWVLFHVPSPFLQVLQSFHLAPLYITICFESSFWVQEGQSSFFFLWWYRGLGGFIWHGLGWLLLEVADCLGKCINFCL